ncbi:hypothetical protein WK91_18560 [Burkholderia cepacia]|uniref:hypothetical protein n=1 Tax=Burkholderia cepacia TaxID=292 RepID=UPI00075E02F5|nr:hypothetical protein [Burkholderia cepacia]KVW15438.1 hypothetical protein WK91_18560 [Burkholderia cepacia]
MNEPILSREELQHAARAILMAVLGDPHEIERGSVTVHFDDAKPGHNALNQMSRRIETELAALLEKLRGEPVAFVCSASNDYAPIIRDKAAAQKLSDEHGDGEIVPLYALNRSKA